VYKGDIICCKALHDVMKAAAVQAVVRVPVSELVRELAEVHSIALPLESVQLEGNFIVLSFGTAPEPSVAAKEDRALRQQGGSGTVGESHTLSPPISHRTSDIHARNSPRRRRAGRRNRMKTRGWNVVTKMPNSRGQTVTIYEPFVTALSGPKQPRRKMEKIVREILVANDNRPGGESIRYFLDNTLEYLAKEHQQ
jgi:hypothetical protein